MSFSTWEQRIEIEKYALNDVYESTFVHNVFSKSLEGTYFVSFSPMLVGEDEILSVECKIGTRLNTDLENVVAYFATMPTAYKNMTYEQLCMSGVYISDDFPLDFFVTLLIKDDREWYVENRNATSFNVSLIKLA